MNISEANDLNNVLRFLLHGNDGRGDDGPTPGSSTLARESAVRLAERAHTALHAGYNGEAVALAWPGNRVDAGEELAATFGLQQHDGSEDGWNDPTLTAGNKR